MAESRPGRLRVTLERRNRSLLCEAQALSLLLAEAQPLAELTPYRDRVAGICHEVEDVAARNLQYLELAHDELLPDILSGEFRKFVALW